MMRARSSQTRDEARAFWTGPPLSIYEELSLRSFLETGARVMIYTGDMTLRVPEGVELIDVKDLLPQATLSFSYDDGDQSLTQHSDLFRYVAVEKYGGWYFDLDIICNKRSLPKVENYIARETDQIVNAAVMKFPARSALLTSAMTDAIKLWPEAGRLTIGPELMTKLISEQDLDSIVRPRSSAYEIGWDEILPMFDPQSRDELDERTADSDFIHLWNEVWRRIRIPKNYGPPEGSFIDGLFRRFDIRFSNDARLSVEAIENWIRERQVISHAAAQGMSSFQAPQAATIPLKNLRKSGKPQTVRTFWGGRGMNAYQLLCLKSFVDRGHRVEVFSYESHTELPRWLRMKDAAEIIAPDRVMRYLPEQESFVIDADLFRFALLHKLGGWWIDPDVVLVSEELPVGDLFLSGPNEFGAVSTAAMKLPVRHPVLDEILRRMTPLDELTSGQEPSGVALLSEVITAEGGDGTAAADATNSISWFDVARLFDPAEADDIEQLSAGKPFIGLHLDVWLRAGIPSSLGPPPGSYLDRLFARHRVGVRFAERMAYDDVRRWLSHMYACVRPGDGLQ
jgi:hypothetical protein